MEQRIANRLKRRLKDSPVSGAEDVIEDSIVTALALAGSEGPSE